MKTLLCFLLSNGRMSVCVIYPFEYAETNALAACKQDLFLDGRISVASFHSATIFIAKFLRGDNPDR